MTFRPTKETYKKIVDKYHPKVLEIVDRRAVSWSPKHNFFMYIIYGNLRIHTMFMFLIKSREDYPV